MTERTWKNVLLGPLGAVLDLLRLQEPWSYSRFLKIYNRYAESRGGWYFEPDGRTPEERRDRYRGNAAVLPHPARIRGIALRVGPAPEPLNAQ